MNSITNISKTERIFYLSDFIYFVDSIDYCHPHSLNIIIGRVLELLILFDRILIPAEHIIIATSEEEVFFKLKFFSHSTIRELVEREKIVTTIWGLCRDTSDHLDASTRYKSEIKANLIKNEILNKHVKEIGVFKRNQKGQSGSALALARKNGWKYGASTEDFLSYSDGCIEIPFSHERLLLGDGREKFADTLSINAAKLAYIQAMPSGNGGIYRSLISSIELANGEGVGGINDRLPSAFFTTTVFRKILAMTGINIPISNRALLHPLWVGEFISISKTKSFKTYQKKVFEALESISKIVFSRTESEAKDVLSYINYIRMSDVFVLGWKMTKLQNIAPIITSAHRKEIQEMYIIIPSRPVIEINRMTQVYRKYF